MKKHSKRFIEWWLDENRLTVAEMREKINKLYGRSIDDDEALKILQTRSANELRFIASVH